MKIGAIIQARMGSTRLSGKVMLPIKDETVLKHVLERVKQSKTLNEIIIATTCNVNDEIIEKEALKYDVKTFRGSEEDVLARYYEAAKLYELDAVVRITSDCPLIDPFVIDDVVNYFISHQMDIVSNAGPDVSSRTYPRGLDVEVFTFDKLEEAFMKADKKYQREHVTQYIYEHTEKKFYFLNNDDLSMHRWTLDTKEDFQLISEIYNRLYDGKHDFYLHDILQVFEKEPKLMMINHHIEQKKTKSYEDN